MGSDASRLGAPTPNFQNLGIQSYARAAGVTAGETLTLCVEPGKTFSVAFYFQGANEALTAAPTATLPALDLQWVTRDGGIYTSAAIASPQKPDLDWNWPWIAFQIPASWTSGVYFAVAYPVDPSTGAPTDALGQAVQAGDPGGKIKPHPDFTTSPILAWDHGMALFVVRSGGSPAAIAYALAVSTYQAYNNTGGGCFYYNSAVTRVTLRRPGCGVGPMIMDDEIDSFDTTSRRNTYAHWDAYFIRWLHAQNLTCDFYTNYDVDGFTAGQPNPLMSGSSPRYRLLLCVGHDEYWSAQIRTNIEAYQAAGGNVAIFSGNTCYRPVGFGAPSTSASRYDPPPVPVPADGKTTMIKLHPSWPDPRNEASTIGVTFRNGAGSWNPSRVRANSGYTSVVPIVGTMGQFGVAASLVGYECDGLFPGHSPANYQVLAHADCTNGAQWDQTGKADMGYFQRDTTAPANKSMLINVATTDWSRFLPLNGSTDPDKILIGQMTLSTIQQLTG